MNKLKGTKKKDRRWTKKAVACLKGIIAIGSMLTLCWEIGTGRAGMFLSSFLLFVILPQLSLKFIQSFKELED